MALRTAHGAAKDALVKVEVRPVDELPALNADDTRVGLAIVKGRGRPFQPGNRAAAGRKPALAASAGIPLDAKDPAYKTCLKQARAYRIQRIKELTVQHGGELSSGVCALITSAALDMASSRYLYQRAAITGDLSLIKIASTVAAAGSQRELTALEIAAREAEARRKTQASTDPLARFRKPA